MENGKEEKREKTIAALQKRFGARVIGKPSAPNGRARPRLATGFPSLDSLLDGGVPCGRVTEIVGSPTAGALTLTLKLIAAAQSQAKTAVYLDTLHTFDPDYAARCGVQLARLLLVRPTTAQEAAALLAELGVSGAIDLLVLDMPLSEQREPANEEALSLAYGRLLAPLRRSDCTLVVLTTLAPGDGASAAAYPQAAALPHYATLRLRLHKERWLYRRQDVNGYAAQVEIAKNKVGRVGQTARLLIDFQHTVQGDCT